MIFCFKLRGFVKEYYNSLREIGFFYFVILGG